MVRKRRQPIKIKRSKAFHSLPEDYNCTIVITGVDAFIEGTFPTKVVQDVTSYYKAGYQFMQKYKSGRWDGRIKLFNRVSRTFPSGLTQDVVKALRKEKVKVMVDDQTSNPVLGPVHQAPSKMGKARFEYPFDFQPKCADALIKGQRGIAAMATNSGKTTVAAIMMYRLRASALFMVPSRELLYQTHRVLKERLGWGDSHIGIIGDGHWSPAYAVTVATVDTLYSRLATPECADFLNSVQLMFIDECHKVGSSSYYQVARACPAFYRFGLSGTPLKRTDGADLRLIGATGPILCEVTNKELIERGVSVQPEVQFVSITKPAIDKGTHYQEAYRRGIVENPYRNKVLCKKAAEFVEQGLSVLILVREIAHGEALDKKLWTYPQRDFIPHQFINGKEDTEVRQKALEEFGSGTIKALIATSILDEGVDVPNIDALILAGGLKSSIKTLQRVGRGLRKGGNIDRLFVVDTIDYHNQYLLKHSLQRFRDYKAENCFIIKEVD